MAKKSEPRKSKRRAPAVGDGKTCFTVMPFGGWFDSYYTDVFVPAIEDAGLKAERADDLYGPSAIVNDIWMMTKRAAIVLADLTGKNPNVFYELGLAHAIAKPAVLVTASLDDVPFDLKSLRVIVYDKNDPDWGDDLRKAIAEAIRETLKRPAESVLPAFLAGPPAGAAHAPKGDNLELLEIRQELRSLRNQMARTSPLVREPFARPEEVRDMINKHFKIGMPRDLIVRELEERGVPSEWALRQIHAAERVSSLAKKLRDVKREAPAPTKASKAGWPLPHGEAEGAKT